MPTNDLYHRRKEQGICAWCGARPALPGRVLCEQCAERSRERGKARLDERKTEGLCIRCGERPAIPGLVYCEICRERNRKECEDRRRERTNLGLCLSCGEYVEDGKTLCPKCRKKANDRWHERQDYRKRNNLCTECGGLAEEGKTLCPECRERQKKRSAEKYAWYKRNGICTNCCSNPADPGKGGLCFDCWAKREEQRVDRETRMSPERMEQIKLRNKEYRKKRRERLKEEGLCVMCGKRPPKEGMTICEQCSDAQKIRMRRMRASNGLSLKQMRAENGLCPLCGEPSAPGKQYCERHIAMHRVSARATWESFSPEKQREISEKRGAVLNRNCIAYRRWKYGNTNVQRKDSER